MTAGSVTVATSGSSLGRLDRFRSMADHDTERLFSWLARFPPIPNLGVDQLSF